MLGKPQLRALIKTLFPAAHDFREEFLQDCFDDIHRRYGAGVDYTTLISSLFSYHYDPDGSEILLTLANYCTGERRKLLDQFLATYQSEPAQQTRSAALAEMGSAHALVVGVGDYQHLTKLSKTVNDATDVAAVLADPRYCGYPEKQVTLLLNKDATKPRILSELRRLATVQNASMITIYFSGHGTALTAEGRREYYLNVFSTASGAGAAAAFQDDTLSNAELKQVFASLSTQKLFFVLDCCFSGGFTVRGPGAPTENSPAEATGEDQLRRAKELASAMHQVGAGSVVIAAAGGTELSREFVADRNGLFTKHFLAGLRGAAPAIGEYIEAFDLYRYIFERVSNTPKSSAQNPAFKGDITGRFPIAVKAAR